MDLQKYLSDLEQHTEQVIEFVNGLNPSQQTFYPEGKWNVLQILEHVLLIERSVILLVSKPAQERSESDSIFGPEKLKRIMLSLRARKINAPERFHPKGNLKEIKQFEPEFRAYRKKLSDGLVNGNIVIDNRVYPHPILGKMTLKDWLEFIPLHTGRHIEQIKDLLNISEV